MSWPSSTCEKIWWVITWPINLALLLTIPDCRRSKLRSWYPFTFIMCVLWIATSSYIIGWVITAIGAYHQRSNIYMNISDSQNRFCKASVYKFCRWNIKKKYRNIIESVERTFCLLSANELQIVRCRICYLWYWINHDSVRFLSIICYQNMPVCWQNIRLMWMSICNWCHNILLEFVDKLLAYC